MTLPVHVDLRWGGRTSSGARRVAVVGYGAMGRLHTKSLRALPRTFVVGGYFDLATSDEGALQDAAHGIHRYASEADAIADSDIVFVTTPTDSHSQVVMRTLAAGRDVFVEKPVGATSAEAAAMLEAARRSGRRIFVGHSERFNPVVRALVRLVPPGTIRSIAMRRVVPSSRARDREGLILNLGVHDLDLAAYLTHSPLEPRSASGGAQHADLALSASRGCAVRIHLGGAGPRERSLRIETRDAIYRGDLLTFRVSVTSRRTGDTRAIAVDLAEPLIEQARAIQRALDGRREGEIATGRDGARAVHAAERSIGLLHFGLLS